MTSVFLCDIMSKVKYVVEVHLVKSSPGITDSADSLVERKGQVPRFEALRSLISGLSDNIRRTVAEFSLRRAICFCSFTSLYLFCGIDALSVFGKGFILCGMHTLCETFTLNANSYVVIRG